MTDNEMLLAMSDLLDKKLQPLKGDIQFLRRQNENDVLPRLQNIESCYTSTYNRYKNGISQIEAMQADIDVMKSVINEHSEKLRRIS